MRGFPDGSDPWTRSGGLTVIPFGGSEWFMVVDWNPGFKWPGRDILLNGVLAHLFCGKEGLGHRFG